MGRTKGAGFRSFLEWCQDEFGMEAGLAHHRALPPRYAGLVDPKLPGWGVIVSNWYPNELVVPLVDLYFNEVEPASRSAALRRECEYSVDAAFKGVYRSALRLLVSPQMCARHANTMWHLTYDSGTVEWIYAPGRIVSTLSGWDGHSKYRCEINRLTAELVLTLIGCKGVKNVMTGCVDRGDAICSSVLTWTV